MYFCRLQYSGFRSENQIAFYVDTNILEKSTASMVKILTAIKIPNLKSIISP